MKIVRVLSEISVIVLSLKIFAKPLSRPWPAAGRLAGSLGEFFLKCFHSSTEIYPIQSATVTQNSDDDYVIRPAARCKCCFKETNSAFYGKTMGHLKPSAPAFG